MEGNASNSLQLVIITGLSGAGLRTAAHAMEDLGWYVVDNLPPAMLPALCEMSSSSGIKSLAVLLDVRTRKMFQQLPSVDNELAKKNIIPQVVFLEASQDVIVRRQESSRRPLPLQGNGRLLEGIDRERVMLSDLRASADLVIDTSTLSNQQLYQRISYAFGQEQSSKLSFVVMSFGFKNGIPIDADLVFDVRFLPNPFWVPELRPKTGLSKDVAEYVMNQDGSHEFLAQVLGLIKIMAPGYIREGKRKVLLAIGCTGGKHRSTSIAEEVTSRLRKAGYIAESLYRDLGKE